jgi:hypothetical protein
MYPENELYVPMLKAKQGELNALSHLKDGAQCLLKPFLDIPRPTDVTGVDVYLKKVSGKIGQAWGGEDTFYVDLSDFPLQLRCGNGRHPLAVCHESLHEVGGKPIPVYGFDRDDDYLRAICRLPELGRWGLCVRLDEDDFVSEEELGGRINQLLTLTGLSMRDVDILIDLRSIIAVSPQALMGIARRGVAWVLGIGRFRSITLAASNFPKDVSGVRRDSVGFVERREFALWQEIHEAFSRQVRVSFGDYGIVHPDFVGGIIAPNRNAKIRYTLESSWMIVRGHAVNETQGAIQNPELSETLVSRREFLGPQFSWGDDYINKCAAREVGPGNPTTWVSVDTSHHLALTSSQVANAVQVITRATEGARV